MPDQPKQLGRPSGFTQEIADHVCTMTTVRVFFAPAALPGIKRQVGHKARAAFAMAEAGRPRRSELKP